MKRALFLATMLLATPAAADEHVWRVGDWKVVATNSGCGFGQLFSEGRSPTDLKVFLFSDGRTALMLKNAGWSITKGTVGDLDIMLDNDVFSASAAVTNDETVMMIPNEEMLAAIATSGSMIAFWNEQPTGNVPLDGSGPALDKVRECLAEVRMREAAKHADERGQDERSLERQLSSNSASRLGPPQAASRSGQQDASVSARLSDND